MAPRIVDARKAVGGAFPDYRTYGDYPDGEPGHFAGFGEWASSNIA
jgi:hypothetical protein